MLMPCWTPKGCHGPIQLKMCYSRLQENKYFEESFQVYERGIALFKWPHVKDIWQAYLTLFVDRYKGTKLERARDLFRQALEKVCWLKAMH